ncbi:MAG: hypothetical protein R2867_35060 [Caldilineaceae bacterium]
MIHKLYWLGGSPCSGKSTIAEALATQYDLTYFSCDNRLWDHVATGDPNLQPTLARLHTMSSDEIWLEPVAAQVDRVFAIDREEFPLLLADLQALATDHPILAEGAALMPELVMQNAVWRTRAAWVVPTPSFQRHYYERRAWVADALKACSDPAQAFANWMARDEAFAAYITQTATAAGLPLLTVDGSHTIVDNTTWVATQLGLTN